jgi:enediyne polyketide synthase
VKYKVSGSTYRTADLAHWLALDVAAQALTDAGYPDSAGLPRDNTAVFLGNTLTGEFSRASVMRLRWPYVRRVVGAALAAKDLSNTERAKLLREIEEAYKRPFAEVGEETLA